MVEKQARTSILSRLRNVNIDYMSDLKLAR